MGHRAHYTAQAVETFLSWVHAEYIAATEASKRISKKPLSE
jgi:hypothetical protein